jgi:apolipoprotein N-acyltransferase
VKRGLKPVLWSLAVISGILQIMPFPIAGPVPFWRTELCWIALVPLFYALTAGDTGDSRHAVRNGALLGYVCGFVWYLGNCYWIYQTMYLYGDIARPVSAGILILFCLYLGLYHALFGAIIRWICSVKGKRAALLVCPFLWVAVEYARAHITGLPWDLLGDAQTDNLPLTQLAPWTGVYGLSFVIVCVNALWLAQIRLRRTRWTLPVFGLCAVLLMAGYWHAAHQLAVRPMPATTATAVLLQQNLGVGAEADSSAGESPAQMLQSFEDLTVHPPQDYLAGIPETPALPHVILLDPKPVTPDLVAWPESPAPFEYHDPTLRSSLSSLAQQIHAPLIVGMTSIERNAAAPERTTFLNKMHLVPFGEYTPFRSLFFVAGNLLQDVGTFSPGTERTLFPIGGANHRHVVGTFICYESIFGDEIRQLAEHGADVLVNISNDGWYGDTSAPWQHLNMVRMRAIENRRWILRSTNSGVTAVIDPDGRVRQSIPRHRRSALVARYGYVEQQTFYTRFGDIFAWLCILVSAAACFFAFQGSRPSDAPRLAPEPLTQA